MKALAAAVGSAVAERWALWAAIATGFVVVYNVMLLAALIVRFGDLPNYATVYDYPGNVLRIVASTPSALDAVEIVRDEWLLEIGFMNYSFGNGISEWSLTILPAKLVLLLAVGALLATTIVLALPARDGACAAASGRKAIGAASGGAALVGFSSATLSWVVCCAAPTWVVSLAMLGMSASLALWLRPFGDVITVSGFALLATAVVVLARRRSGFDAAAPRSAVGSRATAVSP
jgi:hypothetical protein